ncbi:MAG: tetratricopeptide repeat protein [Bacteroidales bacterium]|nr:tetratricopeptide repeat protein [Bacteroidales bacterium]
MKTIDFNYFVERYVSGEMEPEEKRWFEKELSGDPTLVREVSLRRKTNEILMNGDILELRKKMSVISRDHSRKTSVISLRNRVTRYAAMLAVLIAVASLIYLPGRKVSSEDLFNEYFSVAPTASESVTRSSGSGTAEAYMLAVDYYNKGNFQGAINQFLKYTLTNLENPEAFMMLGNSYANIEEYTEAGINYKKVVDHNDNLYIEDANWLLGLCYLRTEEIDKARTQMELIARSDSRHNSQAKDVLRKMNKIRKAE